MTVRVRYAPSPTGYQHIGGIRTALINYLFAQSNKGSFIVRVEDTDRARSKDEYLQDLFESLDWLQINPDESEKRGPFSPYIQSQRVHLYKQYAEQLIAEGHAYYCYTSQQKGEEEFAVNTDHYTSKPYDRSSRDLSESEIEQYKAQGEIPVIRLKMPLEGSITIEDELLGTITRNVEDIIIDPILIKSDGYPTYHLANVVDDHLMEITHVMRSQEWIPSTPVHIYLYQVFNWSPPKYCHLPIVLGEDGQKLSKRNGSLSIKEIRKLGILPQALINCIALLGWSFDDSRELFSLEELKELFAEGKLNKSPSKFSMEKLQWFNAHYIRNLTHDELYEYLLPIFQEKSYASSDINLEVILRQCVSLVQERLVVLEDAPPLLDCIFNDFTITGDCFSELINKLGIEVIIASLQYFKEMYLSHEDSTPSEMEQLLKANLPQIKSTSTALNIGQVLRSLRVAITANTSSLPIIALIYCINKETVLDRLNTAIAILQKE